MSNDVAKLNAQFTAEQLKLITNTVARGASPDELQLFLYRCKNLGLDPLKPGQIHFIKYGTSPGTIVVGIEGFRATAARSGKHVGSKRGVLRDDKGACLGAWAEIYRSDWQHPARSEVSLAEYNTGKGPWSKMPESMIQKVAEAAALRMAFPDDLGGIYTQDEMDQANRKALAKSRIPESGNGILIEEYCCPGNLEGKFKALAKKPISLADPVLLREACEFIEDKAVRMDKKIPEWAKEFIEHAAPVIAKYENALPGEISFDEPGSDG